MDVPYLKSVRCFVVPLAPILHALVLSYRLSQRLDYLCPSYNITYLTLPIYLPTYFSDGDCEHHPRNGSSIGFERTFHGVVLFEIVAGSI